MSYFSQFPDIFYNFELDGSFSLRAVKDIALNVRVRKDIIENVTLYDLYDIEDGETLDQIQTKLYGKPYYHWTFMLLNLRFDYVKDFPMQEFELSEYITMIYGEGNEHDQHMINGNLHYENRDGLIVQKMSEQQFVMLRPSHQTQTYEQYQKQLTSITNFEYEQRLNESKRRIRVLTKSAVDQVIKDIQFLIKK